MNSRKNNWKYLLIIIILAFVAGGVLICQYWELLKEKTKLLEIKREVTPENKKEFIEIPLGELKEGENEIGNVVIEKIELKPTCNVNELEKNFIGYEYLGIQREEGYYELTCDIENKARVKMVGWGTYPMFIISDIAVNGMANNIMNEYDEYFAVAIESFHRNDETFFSITGAYGGTAGITEHFLYKIDNNGDVKFVSSWGCKEEEYAQPPFKCRSYYEIDYALSYKNALYIKIGKEEWESEILEINEEGIVINQFLANKIIIKDSEISFE